MAAARSARQTGRVRASVVAGTAALLVIAVVLNGKGQSIPSEPTELESINILSGLSATVDDALRGVQSYWGAGNNAQFTQPAMGASPVAFGTGGAHFQSVDMALDSAGEALDSAGRAAALAQQAAAVVTPPRVVVSQWSPKSGVTKKMVTTYPGSNPRGSQVQVNIAHSMVQKQVLADPVESAEAQHDVVGLADEERRLKLVSHGEKKILFHKLRLVDDKLHDLVEMREAERKEAMADVEDPTMTKAQNAIRSAQDLLAATHLEKQFHWKLPHGERSKELPSQRALAAAQRARDSLHAKWLRSHPWAAHPVRFMGKQGQTLAMLPAQGSALQGFAQPAAGIEGSSAPAAESSMPGPGGAAGPGAAVADPAGLEGEREAAEEAAAAGIAGEAAADGSSKAAAPPVFHPCTNEGCDLAHMLNMPPLVDEFNRSWVGDNTNRTWLDEMTGGKPTGSSMKDSPFEEIGGGPGQWYVRRFDKETVPGWWETEPGPGDPQGGMIPGPHDRVYHGLEQSTKGEWKKEADGKGGFRWVFYSAWRKPKPEVSEKHGIGMWATEKRADGSVRWVWCGPEGKAGAEGEKSLDEFGEPRMAEGACHGVNLEQEKLKQEKEEEEKEKEDEVKEEETKKEEEEKEEKEREDEAARKAEEKEEVEEEWQNYANEAKEGECN
jgi:hypothetical protein